MKFAIAGVVLLILIIAYFVVFGNPIAAKSPFSVGQDVSTEFHIRSPHLCATVTQESVLKFRGFVEHVTDTKIGVRWMTMYNDGPLAGDLKPEQCYWIRQPRTDGIDTQWNLDWWGNGGQDPLVFTGVKSVFTHEQALAKLKLTAI